jgi:transcriptional antiterminator NusG
MQRETTNSWFALTVRTRSEVLVSSLLQNKGYETFSPTYLKRLRYSDRVKERVAALFPGYIFCRFQPTEILPIVNTPAVQKIVCYGSRPVSITDREIENLRRAAESGYAEPCPYMSAGEKVRVKFGALAGIEGLLVGLKGTQRLVISAELLHRAVSLEIDADQVVPVWRYQMKEHRAMGR